MSRFSFLAGTFPGARAKNEIRPKLDARAATVRKRCAHELHGLTFGGGSKFGFWPDLLFITLWAKSTRPALFWNSSGQNQCAALGIGAKDGPLDCAG